MNFITRFSLKNATAVVIIVAIIVFGGLYSASQLKKETMPDIAIPYVIVTTIYPGAAPNDVYDHVTEPIEKSLAGVEGVKRVHGNSGDSYSLVIAEFSFSQNMDDAEAGVQKALQPVQLPENTVAPKISRIGFNTSPIIKLAITSPEGSGVELDKTVRDDVVSALQGVEGVGEARLAVGNPSRVRLEFDAQALEDEGLTADAVVQQLQAHNLSFPVGAVDLGKSKEPIRVSGTVLSVDDLKAFRVAVYPNQAELMGDAFAAIGDGMGALGSGMGALAQGMGQGFSAVGQGMGALGEGVGAVGQSTGEVAMQAGLINGMQQVQTQMYALKYDTLPQLKAAVSVMPTGTPEYDAMVAQIDQIENEALPGMQAALDDMQSDVTASQKRLQAQAAASSGGAPAAPSAGMSMPSGGGGLKAPSGGSTKMSDPEIGIVSLGDIAKIVVLSGDGSVSRAQGKPAALIDIVKTADANTVDVANAVDAEMKQLDDSLPEGSKYTTVYDASRAINASISGMLREGALGALFAVIVIFIALRNWRATIIAAVAIPFSVLVALLFVGGFDVTLNVMTLGGLTVAIGRVVDDSIVVIENIYRHLQLGAPRTAETVRMATAEVSGPITASTIATVAVFVPLGLVTGIIGKIFQPFAITVSLALMASLLVAITLVPLMAKCMLLSRPVPVSHTDDSKTLSWYRRVLAWSLGHRTVILLTALAVLIASLALIPIIGTGFVPESQEKYLQVEITYPQGTKAEVTDKLTQKVEKFVAAEKDVEFYQATVGGETAFAMSGASGGPQRGVVFLKLKKEADTDEMIKRLRRHTDPLETDDVGIVYQRVDSTGANSALEIVLTGRSPEDIQIASDKIEEALAGSPGLENVTSSLSKGLAQLTVDVDQDKASEYGMNAAMVAGTVRSYVAEQEVGQMKIDGQPTDVVYVMALNKVDKAEQLRDLKLSTPLGDKIKLRAIAAVNTTASPTAVQTNDGNLSASVTGRITERDSGSVINAVNKKLDGLVLPKSVSVELSGAAQQMNESFTQLGMAMLVAVAAVFLVLVVSFGEAAAPLAIMFSLPVAVVGGLVGLLIAGIPLDVPAMIGSLMLIGIVVTNAVVLVDRAQQLVAEGMSRREALLDAGSTRMRPIIMTAATTIIALVPLAAGFGEGTLISQSLAVIVIGGLTTSTMLTLIVVPVAYDVLEAAKGRMFGKKTVDPVAPEAV